MRGPGALGGRVVVRGVTLTSLCARLSASKGSERLADEALVAALGGAHCVEHALAREATEDCIEELGGGKLGDRFRDQLFAEALHLLQCCALTTSK